MTDTILIVGALICFILDTPKASKYNLTAAGLALLAATLII